MSMELYRCSCGYGTQVHRPRGKNRKMGHVKTMWCPKCLCRRGFVRVR